MPVVRMAEEMNIVVVAIRHLNKGSNDNILYRGGGSIAMIGLARVGLMVVKHPHDENIRILINSKNNLSKMAVPLEYGVVGNPESGVPRVEWKGACELTLEEITSTSKPSEGRQLILKALRDEGNQLSVEDIHNATGIENRESVKKLLQRMANAGEIERTARGLYAAKSTPHNSNTP
jgi:hypothetical protein